jgi:hypothetical protein
LYVRMACAVAQSAALPSGGLDNSHTERASVTAKMTAATNRRAARTVRVMVVVNAERS